MISPPQWMLFIRLHTLTCKSYILQLFPLWTFKSVVCTLILTQDQHFTSINAKVEILIAIVIAFDIQKRNKRTSDSFGLNKRDTVSLLRTTGFWRNIKCNNFPFKTMAEFISCAHLNGTHRSCPDMPSSYHYLIHIFIVTEWWGNGVPSATDCQLETASITWSLSEEKEQRENYRILLTALSLCAKTLAVTINKVVNEHFHPLYDFIDDL